jgi:hypothetical protein
MHRRKVEDVGNLLYIKTLGIDFNRESIYFLNYR